MPLVELAFFCSGASGLIFEVVWVYKCGLLFGNTLWATSIVLSSFMAGLVCGNALAARYAPRLRRLLFAYASLEVVVGISGLVLTYVLGVLPGFLAPSTKNLLDHRTLLNLVRLATAFPLLLAPAIAMGATLPVLTGSLSESPKRFGTVLGRLYGWNTLGAVAGVVVTELFLIRAVGVAGSAWTAALLDLVAAAAVISIARTHQSSLPPSDEVVAAREHAQQPKPHEGVGSLLICACLTGGIFMALEVVWFRFLSMFVVASTFAVSLMLAVVLISIATGSFCASRRVARRHDAIRYAAPILWAAASAVIVSYAGFRILTGSLWAAEWYRIVWAGFVLMSGTALLSGVIFVLLSAALRTRRAGSDAAAAGWFLLANTLGAAAGPLIAGFVLLPDLGMERSLFVLAAGYATAGGLILASGGLLARSARSALVFSGAAATLSLALFPFGAMKISYFPRVTAAYAEDGAQLVAAREGVSETIHLMRKSWHGKPLYDRLVTNGFSMSGTHSSAKRYMRYFAYWPLFVRGSALQHALVACYGAGVTTDALTSISSLKSIDVVEISPDIVRMSDIIYPAGHRPLDDARVRLHLEDARYFLQATSDRFDLITGEPPPLLTPGAVTLYTREYFQLIHNRLADQGIATYWLPAARRGEYDVRPIIAAFCAVFDDCSLWNGTVFDWMLVGTRHLRGPVSLERFVQSWSDPSVLPRLRETGFERPEQIGATFLADRDELRRLAGGALPLVDDYPQRLTPQPTRLALASKTTPADRDAADFVERVTNTRNARERFEASSFVRTLWPRELLASSLPYFDIEATINRVMRDGPDPLGHIDELHQLLTQSTVRRPPLWALGSDDAQQEAADVADDSTGMVDYIHGVRALVARQYPLAVESFALAEKSGLRMSTLRPLLAYALCLSDQRDLARQIARQESPARGQEQFWSWLDATFGLRRNGGS
jgi:predicted membrane-bound spermidine synthase